MRGARHTPFYIDAMAYWVISEWLAGRVRTKGGMVSPEGEEHGLFFWGRATTDALQHDTVLRGIYSELNPGGSFDE